MLIFKLSVRSGKRQWEGVISSLSYRFPPSLLLPSKRRNSTNGRRGFRWGRVLDLPRRVRREGISGATDENKPFVVLKSKRLITIIINKMKKNSLLAASVAIPVGITAPERPDELIIAEISSEKTE